MKKSLFLFAVLSTAILSAISVIQFNSNSCDDLLHANIEALAGPGGGEGGEIRCMPEGEECVYFMLLCDSDGKPITCPEGRYIVEEKRIKGLQNLPSQAQ